MVNPQRMSQDKSVTELYLKILKVEVGMIDFLKDSCLIRIYYDEPTDRGNSIEQVMRMPR